MIQYTAKLRITPANGLVEETDLATITHLVGAKPFYDRVSIPKETLNRGTRETIFGYRVRGEVEFLIPQAPHADQDTLGRILDLMADEGSMVELSMGNDEQGQVLYREIGSVSEDAAPVEGVLSMVRYRWTLQSRELIDSPVQPGTGSVPVW